MVNFIDSEQKIKRTAKVKKNENEKVREKKERR